MNRLEILAEGRRGGDVRREVLAVWVSALALERRDAELSPVGWIPPAHLRPQHLHFVVELRGLALGRRRAKGGWFTGPSGNVSLLYQRRTKWSSQVMEVVVDVQAHLCRLSWIPKAPDNVHLD